MPEQRSAQPNGNSVTPNGKTTEINANGKKSRENAPDYNPTSVAGQISVKDMGSRVQHENNTNIATKSANSSSEIPQERLGAPEFQPDTFFESISYRPTNSQNAANFERLTAQVRQLIPDEPHAVILSASDAILECLKNGELSVEAKRSEVESLISAKLSDAELRELVVLTKEITDYEDQKGQENPDGESDAIAVVFDEDTDDTPNTIVEAPELATETGNDDVSEDIQDSAALIGVSEEPKKESTLNIHEIKKDYLFSQLSELEPELESKDVVEICKNVSRVLSDKKVTKEALESSLMEAVDYKHLAFVKLCVENRWKIVFGLKLLQNREKAIAEMKEMGLESLLSDRNTKKRLLLDSEDPAVKKLKPEQVLAETTPKPDRKPQTVDLEGLVFDQGHHLMANAKITLPKGSYQQNKKLYDIISVPAPEGPPLLESLNEELVSISSMPEWAQAAFPVGETATLNRIQSKVYPSAFQSDENLLLCAPTGAGKTNVAMLTILRMLANHREQNGKFNTHLFKAVYVAPLKALVSEQMREFQRRLTAQFGIVVNELTGDLSLSQKEILETQVLVTTPEKWDVVTRKASEQLFTSLVKVLIIDEIHLLHDERGPVLESIIVRAKRQPDTRLVGLSATLPNYQDVARFLGVNVDHGLFYFNALYRPCPLEQQYIGIKEKKAIKKVAAMNEACYEKMDECLRNKHQLIIFVHSRKDTVKTAKWLRDKAAENDLAVLRSGAGTSEILKEEATAATNKNLTEILPSGFGVHHAGLNKNDRSVVEDLFAQGHIQVLVSTATLAWGVNLPAHTVIIKGTDTYNPEKGTWVQLSPQDILQMLGRAGRPRYDKSGEGVIITAQDELQYYLAILNQQLPIESQLMSRLADNLNAEIVLGSVSGRNDAIDWVGQTYLYIRMLAAPKLYQVGAEYADDAVLYWKRADLVHSALELLQQNKLVNYDFESGAVAPTELGKIAAHFYISYPTMGAYNTSLKPWMSEIDVLRVFATSGEFKYVPVRQEEKMEVAKLAEKCPIPIKENASDPLAKVNVLLQTYISRLKLEGFALMADMVYVTQSAGRLLRAIHQICLKKKWAQLASVTLELCKFVEKRMWSTNSPFRQFGDLASNEIIRATEASHLPFMSYFDLSAAELAEAINFKGHSQIAHDLLAQFPKLDLDCQAQPLAPDLVRVLVEMVPNWDWNHKIHGASELFLLTLEDTNGEVLHYVDYVKITPQQARKQLELDFAAPVSDPLPPAYYVTLTSEKWLHSKWRVPVKMFNMRMPKKPSSPSELLDVQTVPTNALKDAKLAATFEFAYFNSVQSQCFHTLWNTNQNAFIGAPKGSGKTLCAELAILNAWRQNKQRIVYLQPSQELIDRLHKLWTRKYSQLTDPPKVVSKLTGDVLADSKIVAQTHLVLATPTQFDAISRRWRLRKAIQTLDVVIADDVHLVGSGTSGVAYETGLSRLRFMAAQLERELRIVALSQPLLYGKEFGEWLGCTKAAVFNFDAAHRVRPIREIRLSPYTDAKLHAAARPCADFLQNKSGLVFVPTRKLATELSTRLLELLPEDRLRVDKVELQPLLDRTHDKTVARLLQQGIGFFHENLSGRDQMIVERAFSTGIVTVLIATRETATYAPQAPNVVVYGTRGTDVYHSSDYAINEILEMVGCCGENQVLVFAHEPRIPYYSRSLSSGLPLESNLGFSLHDPLMHEIACGTLHSLQDCVDWITYTLFYRRLAQNPSFYGLVDVTHVGVSEYLSELVETTLNELSDGGLVEIDEIDEDAEDNDAEDNADDAISPLNGAMIATHYDVAYATMKTFGDLTSKARLRNIVESVTSAAEFDDFPARAEDHRTLASIATRVPLKLASDADFDSPHVKAFLLLQAHLSRIPVAGSLASDQRKMLAIVLKLVNACADTLSSEGHLNALQAMDLSQMIVQGMWNRDSPLLQVPHVDDKMLERGKKYHVETVYDIMSLEDDERDDFLQLGDAELQDVAEFVNKFPNIDVQYEIDIEDPVVANEPKKLTVVIERDEEMDDLAVVSARYPFEKTEAWWVVVGDSASRQLYAIKKTQVARERQEVSLEFTVPNAGHHNLTIWCMCDSYIDADKEMEFEVDVVES